ncbi:alpha/beta hydrolase [Fibrobacter succinogenes]|uniref:poly(ethylene terephthalate) hydrolase family protein n=1 Tax=Fibrobacter succinogenes TaxID=833 RepID=UPI0015662842|nr:alpha/beta hydrolase [Fibrobacter succinogenes]
MKSMVLKGLVMVGALALINCDNNTVVAPGPDELGTKPESSAAIDPMSSAAVGLESSTSVNPQSSTIAAPESSETVNPLSSETVNPASSETVPPASSETVTPASSSSEEVKPAGVFLAEGTDENKDQMQVEYIENIEPCIWDNDKKRNLCKILAYPKQLSDTKKHAVVMWGPGGGSDPKEYGGIIKRLASHGFVVVAIPQSPGDASQGKPALDWLESKNKDPNDPLYNKLDMTKVGCSGHSMGGLESEQMLLKDDRVITAVLNNSGAFNHAELANVSTSKTAAIVYGEGGMERPNAEGDYNNNNVKAPACLLKMTGGQGNECYNGECGWGHGSGPWGGMAATVAWMRWHLGGEDWRKDDFVGTSGKYINGAIIGQPGKWKGQCKNF